MGVVAGRDHDQPRRVRARDRRHHVLDEGEELLAAGPGRHRQVDRVALPLPVARVLGRPGARIERPLVDAGVEHVAVGGEDRLGAVAVVDVPVEHQHPLGAAARRSRGAAATATLLNRQKPIARSRSAWWPGGRSAQNGGRGLAGEQPLRRVGGAAGGVQRGLVGAGARRPCRGRSCRRPRRRSLDRVDVGGVVDALELLARWPPAPRPARARASPRARAPPRSRPAGRRSRDAPPVSWRCEEGCET